MSGLRNLALRLRSELRNGRHVHLKLLRSTTFQGIPFWISAILTGFASVGYSKLMEWISHYPERVFSFSPWLLLLFTPLCFLSGWYIVYRIAPEAGGSGIPQVMAAHDLDQDQDPAAITRLLGLKTMFIKIFSSLLCALGGGAIGREGPTIQIAASIFHAVGKRTEQVWPKVSHRSWIVAGAAAGIASAFNTPLGGIVYAIEELSSVSFGQFKSLLIMAVIISGLVAQWISGPYLLLGFPSIQPFTLSIVPEAIFIGAICGMGGALFGKLLFKLVLFRSRFETQKQLAIITGCVGLSFALIALSVGRPAMGSGLHLITSLLFDPEQDTQWSWIFARFFGSILSYISGCAGGIFSPSLAVGGTLGAELGKLIGSPNSNLLVLLGMISFLTGVTHAPFTSFVLVLEMTDRHSAVFPMMLAAVIAQGVARLIGSHSFYELMKGRFLLKEPRSTRPNDSDTSPTG